MWPQTQVSQRLNIQYPIIQGPMAGGVTTPELVAAVSNAGGLGTLGAGYMAPSQIREAIAAIRRLTDRPFAVNLFAPSPSAEEDPARVARALGRLQPFRETLGLPPAEPPAQVAETFGEQVDVVLAERVPVFSFTFGIPDPAVLAALKANGTCLIGTATSVAEGLALEAAGVDLIVGQGSEAGGHRATFQESFETALIGTLALIPQLADRVRLPVIAAGGIMDGRGIFAALALGASGVQMGTAFIPCPESGAPAAHKQAIIASTDVSTVITRAFSGKPARGIRNRFTAEMAPYEADLPEYPTQNALTREIRQAASRQGRTEFLSLWAGQGAPLSQVKSAADLVQTLVAQVLQVRLSM